MNWIITYLAVRKHNTIDGVSIAYASIVIHDGAWILLAFLPLFAIASVITEKLAKVVSQ